MDVTTEHHKHRRKNYNYKYCGKDLPKTYCYSTSEAKIEAPQYGAQQRE